MRLKPFVTHRRDRVNDCRSTMSLLPLISHRSQDARIAWRHEGEVTARQFLAEVQQLAAVLPRGAHILNMCSDRYCFSVGLAAAIVSGKVSLLPSTHAPEMIRQIRAFAPDVFCLTDSDNCTVDLPQLRYPVMDTIVTDPYPVPLIDSRQQIAVVFTSGSTGVPQPHQKSWGALVSSVQAEACRLGLLSDTGHTLVGTVPPQHMYGFESTVLMAWQSGNALSHTQPFYPADICQALVAVPAPRALVSSPVHLRALREAELPLPALSLVVSATAPLAPQLASDIEASFATALMEIYGSTETGLIATRRPTASAAWHLLPGIRFVEEAGRMRAHGGHVDTREPMSDLIESISDTHFILHGRMHDLINIAGKRHSLDNLNYLLNSLPGVVDGVFYMPDEGSSEQVTRLAACVVAPTLDAAQLLAALREHVDPVFLPRPLLFLDALPRNRTGKLPRAALQALFQTCAVRESA